MAKKKTVPPPSEGRTPSQKSRQRLFAGGVTPYYGAILAVILLTGISAVMVVSASSGEAVLRQTAQAQDPGTTLLAFGDGINNLLFILIGVVAAAAISHIDYRRFGSWSFLFAVAILFLLLYVFINAEIVLGAQRWIEIGSYSLQPSELAKPVLLVFLAYVLTYFSEARQSARLSGSRAIGYVCMPVLIVGVSLLLIVFQPDLGTTLIITAGLLVGYSMSGYNLRFLFAIIPFAFGVFIFRAFATTNYQWQRIQGLIQGLVRGQYSHQVTQGLYALGSGGLLGVGLGLSRQKYFYLPEAQNDFILAVIGEEMGLFGTLLVVGAFALLMWAGLRIARGAKDRMGQVLAAGATTILTTQAIINLLAVIGLGPVTGKPLPFVTLGGSAMLSSFILLGIVLSVARFGGEDREGYEKHDSLFVRVSFAVMHAFERISANPVPSKQRKQRSRKDPIDDYEEGGEDESDLEWRWDRRSRISGPRSRP